MGQFDRQIQTALRLIKKNGQQVDWVKTEETVLNPDMPWLPVGTIETTYRPYICFLPLDLQGRKFLMSLGTAPEIAVGSYYGLMGAVSFIPSKEDKIIRDGQSLSIESIDLLSPNRQKILWTIIVNK